MDDRNDIIATALDWARRGKGVALATVVATWGSAPRGIGARLAIDEDGLFMGSVSGGCVEGEILAAAEEVIATGQPVLRSFGVSDENAWTVGLPCGGSISVFVERIGRGPLLQNLSDDARAGRDAVTLLALDDGERLPLDEALRQKAWDASTRAALEAAAALGRDALVETPAGSFFLEFWRPPLRLVLIGAVHIAQALAPIAAMAGYQVAVVDPRNAFADERRFPGVELVVDWPNEFLRRRPPDSRTALVVLSHEPRIDDPALAAALNSPAFYIGALGSRRSAEKRRERLRAQGFTESDLARVHGPVGLAIGAANPAEIAISVAAELTEALRLRPSAVAIKDAAE
ncbi:XdhC family protein [Rhodoblastus sp.]|uniref:XdhC family protein n=1 Tax=Rhodoblastus sp. TaxID=1962975 RepID=UPI0035AEF48B